MNYLLAVLTFCLIGFISIYVSGVAKEYAEQKKKDAIAISLVSAAILIAIIGIQIHVWATYYGLMLAR